MQSPQDPEITLTHGGLRLVVAPYGASLRGLSRLGPEGALSLAIPARNTRRAGRATS